MVKVAYRLLLSSKNRVKAVARKNGGNFKTVETRTVKAVVDKWLHNDSGVKSVLDENLFGRDNTANSVSDSHSIVTEGKDRRRRDLIQ